MDESEPVFSDAADDAALRATIDPGSVFIWQPNGIGGYFVMLMDLSCGIEDLTDFDHQRGYATLPEARAALHEWLGARET